MFYLSYNSTISNIFFYRDGHGYILEVEGGGGVGEGGGGGGGVGMGGGGGGRLGSGMDVAWLPHWANYNRCRA